jgi:hypothetical protein
MAKRANKIVLFPSISPLGSELSQFLSPEILDFGEQALATCRQMNEGALSAIERIAKSDIYRATRGPSKVLDFPDCRC